MSAEVDYVIDHAQVVSGQAIIEASIAVDQGLIVAVGLRETMPSARERIDARGLYVLPGAIDSHVRLGGRLDISRRKHL